MGDQENFESQNLKDRAWTTDEIRKHSSNWTLAGDVGLFNLLNEFSHQIISRTHEVENAVDSLVHQTKMTSAKINNVINDFHMLSNLQFVENRVYDEEIVEPVSEHKNVPEKTKEQREAEMLPKIIQAIELGLAVLDTAFDRINVNEVSDSEDEEDVSSEGRTILEPKDPYEHRPLPYIIGTEEFMKCDYAGLKDLVDDDVPSYSEESSLSEMDEASSDEGEQLPLDDNEGSYEKQNKAVYKNISDKISSSDESELFGSEKEANDFDSESSLEDKSKEKNIQSVLDSAQPVKEARQNSVSSLQSKLKLPQVLPAPKLQERKKTDDLFASEELDSDEESPFHKKAGLFTSDIKFGEEKDDDLFGDDLFGKSSSKDVKEVKPTKIAKVSVEKSQSIVPDMKRVPETKKPALFDNDDDSEDDIFNTLMKTKKPTSIKVGSEESSEKADTSSSPSSAPSTKPSGNAFDFTIGGGNNDSLFGEDSDKDDLFSNKKGSRKKLDSLENDDLFGTVSIKAPDKDLKEKLVPVKSSVLVSNQNKKGISLFDDDDDEDLEEDIFKVNKETKPFKLNEDTKPLSLFEDSEQIVKKEPELLRSVEKTEASSLFEDSEQIVAKDPEILRSVEKAEASSLFGDTEEEAEVFIPSVPKIQQSKLSSIFDDSENFDLFSPKPSLKEELSHVQSVKVVNTLNPVVDGTSTVSSAATNVNTGDTNVNDQVGFDAPIDSSNILNVISKGRVKVPTKRRKPTRQGRLAALENSKTDSDKTDSEKDSTTKPHQTTLDNSDSLFTDAKSDAKSEFPKLDYKSQEKNKMSLMSQLVSEVSTSKLILKKTAEKEEKDDVDIFSDATKESRSKGSFSFQPPEEKGISSLFPIDNPKNEKDDNDKSKSDSSEDDFFTEPAFKNFRSSISNKEPVLDLDDDEDDDLFSAVKSNVLPKVKTKISDSDLFGDDTDIFADVQKEKYEMFPNQLYDDDDDEDDIFSNISAVSSKLSKTSNSSAVKKVETQQVNIFDDPLTELLKE